MLDWKGSRMAGLQAAASIAFHWLLSRSLRHYISRHPGKQATVKKLSQSLNALYREYEHKQNHVVNLSQKIKNNIVNLLSSCRLKGP